MPTEEEIRQLFAVHNSEFAASERLLRSYGLDVSRQWVGDGGYRLSDSVWRAQKQTRSQIDAVLRQAIADGTDALEVARILEDHLNPALAPVRNVRGRLVRNQPRGVVTRAPGRAGMASFPARRLARTEITRAHAQGTAFAAARTPFAKGLRWNLSGNHPKADECNQRAERDEGLGKGVYEINDFPRMPAHPMCRCFSTIETEGDVDAVVEGLRAKYGLGDAASSSVTDLTNGFAADMQAALRTMGVDASGLRSTDLNIVRNIYSAIAAAAADGLPLPKTVRLIQSSDRIAGNKNKVVAAYSAADDALVLNPSKRIWANAEAHAKEQHAAGWWSSDDPLHAISHELGHQTHFKTIGREAYEARNRDYVRPLGEDGRPLPRNAVSREIAEWQRRVGKEVSRYAMTNQGEFVAEVYAGLRAGVVFSDEVMAAYRAYGGADVAPRRRDRN